MKILPATNSEAQMPSSASRSILLTIAIVVLVGVGIYLMDPTMFGLLRSGRGREGFEGTMDAMANSTAMNPMDLDGPIQTAGTMSNPFSAGGDIDDMAALARMATGDVMETEDFEDGGMQTMQEEFEDDEEGFSNMSQSNGPADFNSAANPPGCYPRDHLTPGELLPKDTNSVWAQQNPMGNGSLKGKNFLSAGALIGINTVGQSLRNANYQLRSEPPNPQVPVTVFNNSTIEPDTNRRDLEIS